MKISFKVILDFFVSVVLIIIFAIGFTDGGIIFTVIAVILFVIYFKTTHKKNNDSVGSTTSTPDFGFKRAYAQEMADNKVKVFCGEYKYILDSEGIENISFLADVDYNGKVVPEKEKSLMLNTAREFKPKTRKTDGLHIIYIENGNTLNFVPLDDSKKEEIKQKYKISGLDNKEVDSAKCKITLKYQKYGYYSGSSSLYAKIGDLENKYLFEDEIKISEKIFNEATPEKVFVVLRIKSPINTEYRIIEDDTDNLYSL